MKSLAIFAVVFASGFAAGNTIPEQRIVGGQYAHLGQFPYQVSLQNASSSHFCGGSIVSDLWIMTAAHCVDQKTSLAEIVVRAGTITRSSGGSLFYPVEQIIHESFSRDTMKADIALLKLDRPIIFDSYTQPIPLPTMEEIDPFSTTLSGWGYLETGAVVLPENLQYLDMTTMEPQKCDTFMIVWRVDQSQICTTGVVNYGVCNGDSGGPLVNEKKEAVGIVSFGMPCGRGMPDVFTRVSFYLDWILSIISQNDDQV